ncbi:MAG: D-alanyl-D-alanine carboxypeptidase family protein [Dehalococcoidia bacterium]|nr:D-alanyl-D-alanine carboxypeptidase family protein [Dehalococcoidia bacterium]MCA9850206.1 D-alanyl-D-alanine carboxypeptidase family protein [Dehalococcoidia bacterium]MCA9857002.1 D-alanyl-D-alanine carboxypeptidase family protein [Dehalococcoidia bacterium]MCB9492070.1 D-alanyl-D-alanine carboxypeptidase family protein [Dehalococcoidia bacterium]
MRLNRRAFLLLSAQVAAIPLLTRCGGSDAGVDIQTATSTETGSPSASPTETATATPASTVPEYYNPDLHQLVSKKYSLAADYVPPNLQAIPDNWLMGGQSGLLRADVIDALEPMMSDAWANDGVDLRIRSAYRSYEEQVRTFNYWVSLLGEEQAKRESAEAGHSEHQLGTTMDFADPYNGWELLESFEDSPSGIWLAEHAWEYGFALSYPKGMEDTTGYIYEPWHHRYIGLEAAAAWHESGLTLIEFLEELNAKADADARRRWNGGSSGG